MSNDPSTVRLPSEAQLDTMLSHIEHLKDFDRTTPEKLLLMAHICCTEFPNLIRAYREVLRVGPPAPKPDAVRELAEAAYKYLVWTREEYRSNPALDARLEIAIFAVHQEQPTSAEPSEASAAAPDAPARSTLPKEPPK